MRLQSLHAARRPWLDVEARVKVLLLMLGELAARAQSFPPPAKSKQNSILPTYSFSWFFPLFAARPGEFAAVARQPAKHG